MLSSEELQKKQRRWNNIDTLESVTSTSQGKIENRPEDLRVPEACNDAYFIRNVSLRHFFVAFHDIQLTGIDCTISCREETFPPEEERSKPRGFIRGNTRIGPVLEV